MAKTFHLTIATVVKNLFDGEAISVSLPGRAGVFEVFAEHEPLVSELASGTARVRDAAGTDHHFELSGTGIAEISHNHTTVLL